MDKNNQKFCVIGCGGVGRTTLTKVLNERLNKTETVELIDVNDIMESDELKDLEQNINVFDNRPKYKINNYRELLVDDYTHFEDTKTGQEKRRERRRKERNKKR